MKTDGHIHTPYCPHGTGDTFEEYIEAALAQNFSEITFTEHAPLPQGFEDPTPDKDSGMKSELLSLYIEDIIKLKEKFRTKIKINVGLEVDFIEGFELESKQFLNEFGPFLDDSILSVHFLKHKNDYYCLDFSDEEFNRMIHIFGNVENIYRSYFETLLKSIETDLGPYKPKRIGHITLVHKFQKKFVCNVNFSQNITTVLDKIQEKQYQLDYNGAGLKKPLCKEPYPPKWVIEEAMKRKIPLVYGSDAHEAKGINQGFESLPYRETLVSPQV